MMNKETRMVKLRSTTSGTFTINEPAYNLRRVFPNKGSIQMVPFEILEQLLWQPGFRVAIDTGMLYIDDMQDKIDLGLEEPDTKIPTNIKVLNEAQMLTLLKVKSYDDFLNEISTLPLEQIRQLADYAAENNLVDIAKVEAIERLTGKDIIKMIDKRREFEAADRAAKAKEENRRREGEFNAI